MTTRQRTHASAALLLAAFVLLLFARLLFTDRVLASGDILHYFYPYRDYAAAAFREGRIPLWNPYIFTGAPFLANPQAAALYPLHWPLSWLPVTKQIYWSAALHAWILALGGYALLRRLGSSWLAGVVTGLVLAGSGFYGGMIGHINQMNAAAWLPWLAWAGIVSSEQLSVSSRRSYIAYYVLRIAYFALFVAFSLLAGHTQTAYINLIGVGVVGIGYWVLGSGQWRGWRAIPNTQYLFSFALVYGIGTLLGVLLSAAQLLPTLEVSGLGLRSGGLSYQEVTSFSLRPLLLPWTLLPSYGLRDLGVVFDTLGYTEFVASVGTLGLLLAVTALWRGRGTPLWWLGVAFAGLGLFLALGRWNPAYYLLYQFIPGFDLFRTPARWMMLYTLGVAILAGEGVGYWVLSIARRQRPSPISNTQYPIPSPRSLTVAVLLVLLAADLLLSALALPHAHPTAPQAVNDLRTAAAHLLTDPARSLHPAAMGRFLSMSTITFDPGDMADWRRIFRESDPPQLDEAAFREFVIALKAQEILAPNLPLLWRIPAADGFDGGVLPLERYNRFLALFIPPDQLIPDGRLREQVKSIPPARLLERMNIRYVITDKVEDLWFEGVYYDRQIGAALGRAGKPTITVAADQPFSATEIHLIGEIEGATAELTGRVLPLVNVTVATGDGNIPLAAISGGGGAGADFADSRLDSPLANSSGATVAFRDVEGGRQEYLVRLPFAQPTTPNLLHLTLSPDTPPGITVTIQAMTLFDARTGTFVPLLPSDRGNFRLVHSGDVKIYERTDGVGRVSLVTSAQAAAGPEVALTLLQASAGEEAVVEADPVTVAGWGLTGSAPGTAQLTGYAPERVVVATTSDAPALLVLRDAFYPGWQATIDGSPVEIYPTDLLFRGVAVPAGKHEVAFVYNPPTWRWGRVLSSAGILIWLLLFGWGWSRRRLAAVV